MFHRLDQPHRAAELLLHVLLGLVAGAAEQRAIEGVDPQARDPLLVQDDHVVLAHLLDGHVGHHVARVVHREATARLGLEPLDLLDRLHDALERQLQGPRDLRVAPALEILEVLLHDLHRDRVRLRVGGELEQQALLHAARGHPGRIEALDALQRRLHRLRRAAHAARDLPHVGPEVAVLVEVADDGLPDAEQLLVVGAEAELLHQVLGERGVAPPQVLEGQLVALFHRHRRALVAVVVEDRGGEVEREVVGALPIDRRRLLRGLLGHLGGGGRGLGGGRRLRAGGGRGGLRGLGVLDRDLLEERVLLQLLAHDLLELERRELEELDRLLQQRGHDDPLAHALYEFHSENFSPR